MIHYCHMSSEFDYWADQFESYRRLADQFDTAAFRNAFAGVEAAANLRGVFAEADLSGVLAEVNSVPDLSGVLAGVDTAALSGAITGLDTAALSGALAGLGSVPDLSGVLAGVDTAALSGAITGLDTAALSGALAGLGSVPDLSGVLAGVDTAALSGAITGLDTAALSGALAGLGSVPDLSGVLAGVDTAALSGAITGLDTAALSGALAGLDSVPDLSGVLAGVDTAALSGILAGIDTAALSSAIAGVDTAALSGALAGFGSVPDLSGVLAGVDTAALSGAIAGLDTSALSSALAGFDTAVLNSAMTVAAMPPGLTSEMFGGAWTHRVAEAVGRLERPEAIDASEAVKDLATVQEAAPPEAQEAVKAWGRWLGEKLLAAAVTEAARQVLLVILALLVVAPLAPAPDLSTTSGLKPVTTALHLPGNWAEGRLPAIVKRAGPAAAEQVVEFFTGQISNPNTRAAYAKAVTHFFNWCGERGLELDQISPVTVAAYVEELQDSYRAPTIRQHLAAIRRLFDWLVVGQVVSWNPTAAVRGPTHVVKRGKTPVLQPEEVRLLFDAIDTSTVGGLRDRALIGVMIYSFARVSTVVNMDVDDYYQEDKRWWLRLREKGGKHRALPVHHKAEAYLDAYLEGAGISTERGSPLWRSLTRTRELGERRMSRVDVFRMVKRRVKAAELGDATNCHTFRASGITAYLLNGGTLERAQVIAGHESPRTTQLYDRTADDITVEDIERIKV